ncbi:MAG: FxsA family protein [Alphaproteobacteria bacterium]
MGVILTVLALIAVPLIEIAVLVTVGRHIGVLPTLGLLLLAALAGTTLLRVQGFAVLRRAQEALDRDEFPVVEVFDGVCLLVAGALLLAPGFVTDVLALILLLPPVRALLRRILARHWLATGAIHVSPEDMAAGPGETDERGRVIEGEFRVIGEEPPGDKAGRGDKGGREGSP